MLGKNSDFWTLFESNVIYKDQQAKHSMSRIPIDGDIYKFYINKDFDSHSQLRLASSIKRSVIIQVSHYNNKYNNIAIAAMLNCIYDCLHNK